MKRAALFAVLVAGCVASASVERMTIGRQASALSVPVNIASFEPYPQTFGGVKDFTVVGSRVIFGATTAVTGSEPWSTDGTSAGTSMIRDMNGGVANGFVASVALGSSAILALNDGAHGSELWKSDGTAAGTTLLKDLYAGSYGGVSSLYAAGGVVYASVTGDAAALWKTDGTAGGTTKLADTSAEVMAEANGAVFFRGTGGLWKTNGTSAGTTLVSATTPATLAGTSMVSLGGTVFFVNQSNLTELWKSDGTTTSLVQAFPMAVDRLAVSGTKVFLRSATSASRLELWATDGTTTTSLVVPSPQAGAAQALDHLVPSNGALYFVANDGTTGVEMWKSDGTPGGTARIADLHPGSTDGVVSGVRPVAWNDGVVFTGRTTSVDFEPWFTNGGAPQKIFDVVPGTSSGSPGDYFVNGTTLYFFITAPGAVKQLWKSTGVGNASLVKDDLSAAQVGPQAFDVISSASLGGALYFGASNPRQLWKSDGTKAGTSAITSSANAGFGQVGKLVVAGGKLYFPASDSSVTGLELFTSDGTTAGTTLAADVPPAGSASTPSFLVAGGAGGATVFFAANGTEGQEAFRYSAAGGLVQIANSLRVAGSEPRDLVAFGPGVYFTGQPQSSVRDLYYNDGVATFSNTVSGSGNSGIIGPVVATGNAVYFVKSDTTNGIELWKTTPGNPATLVKDIAPGVASSNPQSLTAVGNLLYFVASSDANMVDRELWVTDGTANGTVIVKDLYTLAGPNGGLGGSRPRRLGAVGQKLVFVADDGTGDKWFVTDGTPGGTVKLGDVSPGSCGPMGDGATIVVCGADGFGNELWTSDGTAGSLTRWTDLAPGPASANPELVAVHGGKIFFTAITGGKLEMYAGDFLAPGADAGPDAPVVVDSGNASGSSGASSGGSSGGTVIDDPSADGVPVSEGSTEESGCSIAAAGMRRKRGR